MKILHVLYQSIPDVAGSTIRSRDIVESQAKIGLVPVVLTSPFQGSSNSERETEAFNNIVYYRSSRSTANELASEKTTVKISLLLKKFFRLFPFAVKVYKVARKEKVDIIHAHSMFFCALPAELTGLLIRKPVVYEVRSLWEERGRKERPLLTKMFKAMENLSMYKASHIVTINDGLRDDLARRGVDIHKVSLIRNAVNFSLIKEQVSSILHKSKEEVSFGYIGTISPIEGLLNLLKAFERLRSHGFENVLWLYGDGIEKEKLIEYVTTKQIPNIKIEASLSPSEVWKAYGRMDIIVNPRISSKITESVTPLKPIEAMAYKKLVVASDVGGMRELIQHETTGYLFDSKQPQMLANLLIRILNEKKGVVSQVVQNGYEFAKLEKNWLTNAKKYADLYNRLVNGE